MSGRNSVDSCLPPYPTFPTTDKDNNASFSGTSQAAIGSGWVNSLRKSSSMGSFLFGPAGTNTGTRQMTKSPTWLSMLSSGAVSESGVEDPFSNGPLSHQHMVYCSESFRSPGPASADCVTAPHPPSRLSHDSLSSSTVAATTTGQPNVPACLAPPSTLQTVKSEEMHAVICNPAGPDPCVPKAKHVRTPSATSNWTSNIGTWNMGAPPSSRF